MPKIGAFFQKFFKIRHCGGLKKYFFNKAASFIGAGTVF